MDEKTYTTKLGEEIDKLGQEILARAFAYTDRLRNKEKISADEEYMQVQMQTQFKYLETTYNRLLKMGRLTGVEGSTSDENFLKKVMQMKPSVARIVVDDTTKDQQ